MSSSLLPSPIGQSASQNSRKIFPFALSTNLLSQLSSFALNSSTSVKIFCLCVLSGYLLSFNEVTVKYLSVLPGKLLPPNFYVWSLITHSFIETRIIELLADWFIILLYSKMIEPLWGVYECIQFYFIITVIFYLILFKKIT